MKKTTKGRVVYNRKVHFVSVLDVARFAAKCSVWEIPPTKALKFVLDMSNFIQRLITELVLQKLSEAVINSLAGEIGAILRVLFFAMKGFSGIIWSAILSVGYDYFKSNKR